MDMREQITTSEALDALPNGSVFRDAKHRAYVIKQGVKGNRGVLRIDGNDIDTVWIGSTRNVVFPATVVYRPSDLTPRRGRIAVPSPNPLLQATLDDSPDHLPAPDERTETVARVAYRALYPGHVNTHDSARTPESDAAERDRAYETWDAGHEGYAPGRTCRDLAAAVVAALDPDE